MYADVGKRKGITQDTSHDTTQFATEESLRNVFDNCLTFIAIESGIQLPGVTLDKTFLSELEHIFLSGSPVFQCRHL